MSIVSGYKKFKKYILTSSGFQLVSHWTNANTLQFDDGKTAQAKLGTIDGISSSKDSSSDKIAASTKLVSELNSDLSGQFGGMTFWVNDTGDPCVTYKVGADSVSKKLGNSFLYIPNIYAQAHGDNRQCQCSFKIDVANYKYFIIGSASANYGWGRLNFTGYKKNGGSESISSPIGNTIDVTSYNIIFVDSVCKVGSSFATINFNDIKAYN